MLIFHSRNPRCACAPRGNCACVCVCVSTLIQATRLPISDIPAASVLHEPENEKGDFPETTAFESDKLAQSRTALRGPTHQ